MKLIYLFSLLVCVITGSFAQQNASITGKLQDTAEFKTVAYASVMALNPSDSTLLAYTWAADDGSFVLRHLPAGRIRLLITRPGFADYEDYLFLEDGANKDLGLMFNFSLTKFIPDKLVDLISKNMLTFVG